MSPSDPTQNAGTDVYAQIDLQVLEDAFVALDGLINPVFLNMSQHGWEIRSTEQNSFTVANIWLSQERFEELSASSTHTAPVLVNHVLEVIDLFKENNLCVKIKYSSDNNMLMIEGGEMTYSMNCLSMNEVREPVSDINSEQPVTITLRAKELKYLFPEVENRSTTTIIKFDSTRDKLSVQTDLSEMYGMDHTVSTVTKPVDVVVGHLGDTEIVSSEYLTHKLGRMIEGLYDFQYVSIHLGNSSPLSMTTATRYNNELNEFDVISLTISNIVESSNKDTSATKLDSGVEIHF